MPWRYGHRRRFGKYLALACLLYLLLILTLAAYGIPTFFLLSFF